MKLRAFFIRTGRLGRLLLLAAAACIASPDCCWPSAIHAPTP